MHSKHIHFCVITLLCFFISVYGFPTGAPSSVCVTGYPHHNVYDRQTTVSPFKIELNSSIYNVSDVINIRLYATDGRGFKGVTIGAHRQSGDTEELLGSFTTDMDNKTQARDCFGGSANFVTHKNADNVTEIQLQWRAPATNVGNITFRGAFVVSYQLFWLDVTADIASVTPIQQTIVNKLMATPISINYNDCGNTMGCYMFPKKCDDDDDCEIGLTFTSTQDHVTFTMFTKEGSYVSMGLSEDTLMGQDQTFTCTYSGSDFTIQHGYNPLRYNAREYLEDRLTNMSAVYRDGTLYCTFTRPKSMNVYDVNHNVVTFNLSQKFYVFLARGELYTGTPEIRKHSKVPETPTDKLDFAVYSSTIGEGSSVHAIGKVQLTLFCLWITIIRLCP